MANSRAEISNVSDYIFEEINFISERLSEPINIAPIVTDLEIFENLDLPYLTGKLVISDNSNLYQNFDVLGAERIQVIFRTLSPGSGKLSKTFYISSINGNVKDTDHTDVLYFQLVEDIWYSSNLQNVNKFYSGTGASIIEKICKEFLSKEVGFIGRDLKNFNVIIPNFNPLKAVSWINNRISTTEGYPFYLFSTLYGEKLAMADLGSLLALTPINEKPYKGYSTSSDAFGVAERDLKQFVFERSEELHAIIDRGLIGAEYRYIDTLTNKKNKFTFDVVKDVFKPLIESGILSDQDNVGYSPDYKLDGKSFNEIKNRTISRIGGSNAYRTDIRFDVSFDESKLISDYKRNIKSLAMIEFLNKAPLTFTVNGLDFAYAQSHYTIGNNININFLNSLVDNTSNRIDTKRSGNYLITNARHMFKKEKYDLVMTGLKIANPERI